MNNEGEGEATSTPVCLKTTVLPLVIQVRTHVVKLESYKL